MLLAFLEREMGDNCYVSFSAGKDSSVVAHACQRIRPGIQMLMADSGVPIRWTAEERDTWMSYVAEQEWNLKVFPYDKYGKARPSSVDRKAYAHSIHLDQFADLTEWANQHGLTRRLMGLRRAESKNRQHVAKATKNTICPIADWSQDDVWCYIVSHGLPWLTIYDYIGPHARNGLIGKSGEAHGRLVYLKKFYPAAYQEARRLGVIDE
jgi:3'-phosphoadenosine 5'-phosphosulfate sulfotransferase (PAPS reductase)/FAD synthetase